MNIVFLFSGSFPIGKAYANRILTISKGIEELGHKVKVLVLYPGDFNKDNLNGSNQGVYDDVEYIYCNTTSSKPRNIFQKLYYLIEGICKSVVIFLEFYNKNKIDIVVACSSNTFQIFPYFILSKIKNFILIREKNEYPREILYPTLYNRIKWRLKSLYFYYLFDGFIFITFTLKLFFTKYINKNAKSLVVPIIVEPKKFECEKRIILKKNAASKYITFCGSSYGVKDGIPILLKAFKKTLETNNGYKLLFTGDILDKTKYIEIHNIIEEENLEEYIEFTGWLKYEQLYNYLCESDILVLASPSCKQTEGNFPTKLGEYLATGKPVVITDVGEITDYLKDGVNAYIAEPDSVDSFAEKLLYVIDHNDEAKKVGLQGKELALTVFNYKYQAERIIEFFESFYNPT